MMVNVVEMSIHELCMGQKQGLFSAEDLVYSYMERIKLYDKGKKGINSVLELNPDAPALARGLDTLRQMGNPMGPLHGIPVLLKDNINTGDRLHTSAGSLCLADSFAPDDAYLVKLLRNAGAVILGKANMTEWANYMTRDMPGGYSSRGGQVKNPYGEDLSPGGSSSGPGAATAANLCAVSVGTETSGSILSPSIENMLVGIKPTTGLISRSGIIPISPSQDTAGPMARTVEDAARLLMAVRGVDSTDPITISSTPHIRTNYLRELNKEIGNVRIGVPREAIWKDLSQAEKEATENVLQRLVDRGVHIVDPADFKTASELGSSRTMFHEFKGALNYYLHNLGPDNKIKTLEDIIQFNIEHSDRALKYGQTILTEVWEESTGTLTDREYLEDRLNDIRICKTQGIDAVMAENHLDLLLFPSYTGCAIAAKAGYPSITIPTGFIMEEGIRKPFGISLTGPAFSEPLLIRCAHALERELKGRIPPEMLKSEQ
jgi:amidase